jgi:uncharacterized membrane protein
MIETVFHVSALFLAFAGFLLSFYIFEHKRHQKRPLFCPMKSDCTPVITSRYSKFLGVPLEIYGMLYYGFVALFHAMLLLNPALDTAAIKLFLLVLATGAFFFSIYLVLVQAVALKKWCTWCLMSSSICLILFMLHSTLIRVDLVSIVVAYKPLVLVLHILAGALGIGAATVGDILFIQSLRDYYISEKEAVVLKTCSKIIWTGLVLFILTSMMLYASDAERLSYSAQFWISVLALLVLVVNALLLNAFIAPKLIRIATGQSHTHTAGELHHYRRIAFALSAVSLFSWYFIFILSLIRERAVSSLGLLGTYFAVLGIAVISSQIFDHFYSRHFEE